jgi:hypothetical protein
VRVGRLDRRLLRGLLNPLEHRLQQTSLSLRVAQHRVQRDLRLCVTRGLCLLFAQVALQRDHAVTIRTHIGVDGGNDPTNLRGDVVIHIGKLCADRLNVRVAGPEPSQHRLQLRGKLIVARPHLHDRRRDRRLRGSAGPSAGGVQLSFRLGQCATSLREVLGQQAELPERVLPSPHIDANWLTRWEI